MSDGHCSRHPAPLPGQEREITYQKAGADYFQTVRIPVIKGRAFLAKEGDSVIQFRRSRPALPFVLRGEEARRGHKLLTEAVSVVSESQ
jgi:hypothetical protein